MTTRLNKKDFKVLKAGGGHIVGENQLWNSPIFGSLPNKDHVEIHVYDMDDNIIKSSKISDYDVNNGIKLKPGDDLRRLGFLSGDYKVEYNFLRYVAGNDEYVLTRNTQDHEGEVYSGPSWITGQSAQPYWVDDDGKIYLGEKGDTQYVEELEIQDLKYYIQAISSNKTELRLIPLNINLDSYKSEFSRLYTDENKYLSLKDDGSGGITFPNILETLVQFDKHGTDEGVSDAMIGGTLTVKNVFKIGEEISHQSIAAFNFNDSSIVANDTGAPWTAADETGWDQSLQSDAIQLTGAAGEIISYGFAGWVPNPWAGNHAKIVNSEGPDGGIALKFIDQNAQFGVAGRSMPIFVYMKTPASKGVNHGDKIKLTFKQKSSVYNKGIVALLKHDVTLEDTPPITDDLVVGDTSPLGNWMWDRKTPDGNYTPTGNWYPYDPDEDDPVGDIQYWRNALSDNPIDPPQGFNIQNPASQAGTLSDDGIWEWKEFIEQIGNSGYSLAKCQWVKKESSKYISFNRASDFSNEKDIWQDFEYLITIPADFDLDGENRLSLYGQYGDTEGTVLVSDVKVEYLFTDSEIITPVYADFVSGIEEIVTTNQFKIKDNWNASAIAAGHIGGEPITTVPFEDWHITYKTGDNSELNTLLNFGNNDLYLTTNYKKDAESVAQYPHSIVYKLYKPLSGDIEVGDLCYVVKEMAPPHKDQITLIPFVEDKIDAVVLRQPNLNDIDSPYAGGETSYVTKNTLVTSDDTVSTALENLILSSSNESVNLNIDYTKFANFVHFGSVNKRLKNFKTKLLNIETAVAASASLAANNYPATSSLTTQIQEYEKTVYKIKNELDGFEYYMYYNSSSYASNSLGEFHSNSWPKDNSTEPYSLSPVTASNAVIWYDAQFASASSYDNENGNRLINLTPLHISDNTENSDYLDFVDMTGHFFDNIWLYIKNMPTIHNRDEKLTTGLSKDLIYDVAKSMGWQMYNGKSLIDLPKYKLGLENTGSSWTVYSATAEEDISKEIWNRVINNMPYFLKTKGTERAIRGLINCYGIPSTILKIKEYGGPDIPGTKPSYDLTRRFTKAIDFSGGQYVQTTWVADTNSSRVPDTVEFRFKTSTGSNQTLMHSGDNWAMYLKDNGSTDNYGYVGFQLSGSGGYLHISSSQLPVYDGEFYSVMLKRQLVPATASIVSESSVSYLDKYLQLGSVSDFPSSGEVTVQSDTGKDITLKYSSKNDNTNQLMGVSGWETRQPKSNDTNIATASISTGAKIQPVVKLSSDDASQDVKYELFVKKYNASTDRIHIQSYASLLISGSVGAVSESYNAAYSSSAIMYIGGEPGNPYGAQYSGSMMEFRYWNSPLNETAFDNHVGAPKAFNGNHTSASYTDLVLRYSFDDNINHTVNSAVLDSSADQSYTQAGTATNFPNEINYSNVEDVQKMFVPDVSPSRRMSSKVRIESNTIKPDSSGYVTLDNKNRKETSAFDRAPVDSNKVGIYFAPTDVINEDIILSVANLDFNKYIGDPRDADKVFYPDLNSIADTYWQKYKSPNNFWDYIRLLKYYDTSLYDQLKRLIPMRSNAHVGLVIESNIFERSKVVVSRDLNWDNEYYEGIVNVSDGYDGTAQISASGTDPYYETVIGYSTAHSSSFMSDIFRRPTLYNLTGSKYYGNLYATASVDKGGPQRVFEEGVEPYVSGSRISARNYIREYFYSSAISMSVDNYHSSSLYRAPYNTINYSTPIMRLYYEGCVQTKETTPDGGLPVEVTITSPTELITKEPGESKLAVK